MPLKRSTDLYITNEWSKMRKHETSLLVKREFMMTEVALAFTTGAFSTEEEWGRAGGGILLSPSSTYSGQKNVREERVGMT